MACCGKITHKWRSVGDGRWVLVTAMFSKRTPYSIEKTPQGNYNVLSDDIVIKNRPSLSRAKHSLKGIAV
jgi:hypothetical protein